LGCRSSACAINCTAVSLPFAPLTCRFYPLAERHARVNATELARHGQQYTYDNEPDPRVFRKVGGESQGL
jgi:hypothetical protein